MMRPWALKLKLMDRTIDTHVYSDTGEDIVERFPNCEVSDIRPLDRDPTTASGENRNEPR
jgi:hypothetical protein